MTDVEKIVEFFGEPDRREYGENYVMLYYKKYTLILVREDDDTISLGVMGLLTEGNDKVIVFEPLITFV